MEERRRRPRQRMIALWLVLLAPLGSAEEVSIVVLSDCTRPDFPCLATTLSLESLPEISECGTCACAAVALIGESSSYTAAGVNLNIGEVVIRDVQASMLIDEGCRPSIVIEDGAGSAIFGEQRDYDQIVVLSSKGGDITERTVIPAKEVVTTSLADQVVIEKPWGLPELAYRVVEYDIRNGYRLPGSERATVIQVRASLVNIGDGSSVSREVFGLRTGESWYLLELDTTFLGVVELSKNHNVAIFAVFRGRSIDFTFFDGNSLCFYRYSPD